MNHWLPYCVGMLAVLLFGCGSGEKLSTPTRAVALVPRTAQPAQVVARVNGVPILAEDLRLQMQRGDTREAALSVLIDEELLAQEAQRRGFDRHREVLREQRRAMSDLFIRRDFGDKFTKRSITPEVLKAAYEINKIRYVHPELVEVSHILVRARRRAGAAHHRRAQHAAQQVHAIAVAGRLSEEEFRQIAKLVAAQSPGLEIRAESLVTPLRGLTVPAFADAAFALRAPGQISPVVQTHYGYHVIYFKKRTPAQSIPLAQVEDELRERVFEDARRDAFLRWAEGVERRNSATIVHAPTATEPR